MDELLLNALDLAGVKGAQYADIRLVNTTQERLVVRNGVVDTLSNDQSRRHICGVTDVSGNTASSLGLASNGCMHALRDDVKKPPRARLRRALYGRLRASSAF